MQARAEELAGQAHALEGRCAELEIALKAERIRRNDLAATARGGRSTCGHGSYPSSHSTC